MPEIDPRGLIPGVFLMKPARPGRASGDLFRERLDAIVDMRHPLVRLLAQQPKDKMKLYSLHAPEVVCIAKGLRSNGAEPGP